MSKEPLFRGVGVALVTLFDEDGELDAPATADLAARLVDLGVRAVVVAGTTGEAAALGTDERTELLVAVRKMLPEEAGVPLIAGVGAPSARQAVRLTAAARDSGADAMLALSPPGTSEPRTYYEAVVAAAGDTPVLAYHLPRVSPPGIPLGLLGGLPVAGLKDSSGDATRLLAIRNSWDQPVYPGSASLVSLAATVGCPGVILGNANASPETCAAAFAGDAAAQLDLVRPKTTETRFPSWLKHLVAERFGCSTVTRMG